AKVLVLRGLLPTFEALLAAFPIHVGQRDDILGLALAQIAERLAARADAGDVQFFVGRLIAQRLERRDGSLWQCAGEQPAEPELASRNGHCKAPLSSIGVGSSCTADRQSAVQPENCCSKLEAQRKRDDAWRPGRRRTPEIVVDLSATGIELGGGVQCAELRVVENVVGLSSEF